jgi:filamentous hemagglutinin family protein
VKNSITKTPFVVRPLAAAVALLVSAALNAAPTPNQMPGAGRVTNLSPGAAVAYGVTEAVATANPIVVGDSITGLQSTGWVGVGGPNARAVIQWGGAGAPVDLANPAGFNVGSAGKMQFVADAPGAAILNIDASGNPSQIFGAMVSTNAIAGCPGCNFAPTIYLANTNGIIVGASGRIVAPTGVGLIGADLNNATAKHDFVANNEFGESFIDVTGGHAPVTIAGAINGSLTTNTPASFILVVGGDVTNTGNLFGQQVDIAAGIRATATKATVAGVTNVTVNRLWDVDAASSAVDGNLGTNPGNVEIANAANSFVNTGSISSQFGFIGVEAANSIRSGTAGDTSLLTGLYADSGVVLSTFSPTSKIELFNVVTGYTTGTTMPFLFINQQTGAQGDVLIEALTPASQPSSITTTGDVLINGTNVVINSTINHKVDTSASDNGDDLIIVGDKSVTISKDVGAEEDVSVYSPGGTVTITGNVISDRNKGGLGGIFIANDTMGPGPQGVMTISGNLTSYSDNGVFVGAQGPLTISGNITSGDGSYGSVYISNRGTQAGNTTTISGNITADSEIRIGNEGLTSSKLDITGKLAAGTDVDVYSYGHLSIGQVTAGSDIDLEALGTTVALNGALTAGDDIDVNALAATTKLLPAAVLTAPSVYLDVLNFVGVNASGNAYTKLDEKPTAQILTNYLGLDILGSINAPIAGNTNWLDNAMVIAPLFTAAPVDISMSAIGGGFQAINLKIDGNATIDSGATVTPFLDVGLTTGTQYAGGLIPNGGSQLIVNATGNLDVYAGNSFVPPPPPPLENEFVSPAVTGPAAFQFPGGVAFKAGGTLTVHAPVYNAWTTAALPFQGAFFEAPTIVMLGYLATNGNSWGNWSTMPTTGTPTVYQINQLAPTTFGFVNNPDAVHKNTYSSLILGGPTCFTPAPAAWTACP